MKARNTVEWFIMLAAGPGRKPKFDENHSIYLK